MRVTPLRHLTTAALAVALVACGGKDKPGPSPGDGTSRAADAAPASPKLAADKGVDVDKKVIRIGALNDESGPASVIGKPFALGKRVLVAQINAGEGGLLPAGWTVELIEKDHGYNPQKSVAAYNEIKNDVLFIATSFGTPNTLPLAPHLKRDTLVAFPASLSSKMAENKWTPPVGPSYVIEARRGLDWIAAAAGEGKADVKLGIVYQQDDYGADGLAGFKAGAKHHGLTIVAEETVTPGQQDFTAVVTALKSKGATHVLLTTLPSATGPILGGAAQLEYMPTWVGNTPSWVDAFFNPKVIPPVVFTNFHLVFGLPYWGEDVPGMKGFLAAWDKFGKGEGAPDFYVLLSYIQGLAELTAAKAAIEAGDITRAGYVSALQKLDKWTAGGLSQPLSFTTVPYRTGTRTRVLKPDMAKKSWTEVAPYAEPQG